ncbi:restriction endonuclease [Aeromonas veronii]|uniref:restriction endonuclease n=1 Tax=Aeromonas veronii TaxID=654 RepID=UPI00058A3608|nr:restriction endonuclease [Aeromonas veronii]
MNIQNLQLLEWQQRFVDEFVVSKSQRNMLIAAAGTGKTVTSIVAANQKLKTGKSKKVAIITDYLQLRDQWRYVAGKNGLNLADNVKGLSNSSNDGASLTYQSLINDHRLELLREQASSGGLLVIVDDVDRYQKRAIKVCDEILRRNESNQCLFISRTPIIGHSLDWTYKFGKEYIFEPKIIQLPETKIQIARFSPSFSLLSHLQHQTYSLDDLNWRQFEVLVSELLESDGYQIELMSGTKDGGVDIVAVKDLAESGMFKALWQAKKYSSSRKIGISTIRELADVRNEHNASKGIIVTSSFLTSGALQRVERDKYILGKVDRNDLMVWIDRKLYE